MPVPDFLREPLTMYEIAEQYWDLKFIPTQYVFSLLAQVSEDKLERDKCFELSSPEGQEEWLNYCRRPRRTVIEVLQDFHKSTSKLTLEILFELFSPIKPRSFSIASSSLQNQRHLEILVAVVHYYSKMKHPRLGLASNWLKSLNSGDRIYGWLKNGTFVFPTDTNTPCILIGPGTGMAPYRSLVLEREANNTATKDTLIIYFGCRYSNKDFHCRGDLERLAGEGRITLVSAFSREQESKIYVQHKIAENHDALWPQINENKAIIYISGNAKNMPDNVKEAFEEMFQAKAGLSAEEAKDVVKEMECEGRLQIETW